MGVKGDLTFSAFSGLDRKAKGILCHSQARRGYFLGTGRCNAIQLCLSIEICLRVAQAALQRKGSLHKVQQRELLNKKMMACSKKIEGTLTPSPTLPPCISVHLSSPGGTVGHLYFSLFTETMDDSPIPPPPDPECNCLACCFQPTFSPLKVYTNPLLLPLSRGISSIIASASLLHQGWFQHCVKML